MHRAARILGLGLVLSSVACEQELDSKPAADPLDDPWVQSFEEEPTPMVASEPVIAPTPTLAVDPSASGTGAEVVAVVEPGTVSAGTTELAKVAAATSPGVESASTPSTTPGATTPEPTPSADVPAQPSEADVPVATIDPAPTPVEPAKPVAAPAITYVDFAGNYRFSGGSAQRADLTQAIEDAVMQLAMPIRGIGRKRLTNTNPIDDTLEIVVTGDKVQTIFESGFDAECTIDGGTVHWTSKKNDKYKVRVRKKDSKIVQVIEGEDGVKTTVFVLSADKQSLTVHHKITADRLDEPMTYKLSYKRK
jgi:hypothetical protein